MKKSIPLILLFAIMTLVGSGVSYQAKSFWGSSFGSYKSCLHNYDEFAQIGVNQSCFNPHQDIGNPRIKHGGVNPDDCILEEFIIIGELD